MKRYFFLLSLILVQFVGFAQKQDKIEITQRDYDNKQVEMADQFRQDGKIYVVVAVILAILGGLFVYLFVLDNKIKELEKLNKNK